MVSSQVDSSDIFSDANEMQAYAAMKDEALALSPMASQVDQQVAAISQVKPKQVSR